ncbi:MAG: cupredoxin domain-containing protein [Microthrixaceae bacterium]
MRRAHRSRRAAPALLLVVVATLAVACGGGSSSSSSSGGDDGLPKVPAKDFVDETGKKAVTVEAVDNNFDPQYVTVSKGTTITFTNAGRNPHNVVPVEQGAFSPIPTEKFAPGDSGTITLSSPGTYAYYCTLHGAATRGMAGRIVVER